jgi:hypothetical protein
MINCAVAAAIVRHSAALCQDSSKIAVAAVYRHH